MEEVLIFFKKRKKLSDRLTKMQYPKDDQQQFYRDRAENWTVFGDFWTGGFPCSLEIPFWIDDNSQLFAKGFLKPASKWSKRTTFKYLGTEFADKNLAKWAQKATNVSWVAGTGTKP